jgi:hypothetical protein
MSAVFGWIESSALSVWMRESNSVFVYPAILSAHTIGMAFAAGVNAAIALHLLGAAPGIPIADMRRYTAVLWIGFWLNAASGVMLLIAYPTKAMTNPVFYLKLTLIALGLAIFAVVTRRLAREPTLVSWTPAKKKLIGVASLVSWGGAIAAGRLLAYTYRHLFAGR